MLLQSYTAQRADACLWCDVRAEGGERWLLDREHAPEGWLFCTAKCYARTVDAMSETPETRTGFRTAVIDLLGYYERRRFTDAFVAGQKALTEGR